MTDSVHRQYFHACRYGTVGFRLLTTSTFVVSIVTIRLLNEWLWADALFRVALFAPSKAWARTTLFGFLVLWGAAMVGSVYTVLNLFLGLATHPVASWTGTVCFAWYLTMYLAGLRLNIAAWRQDTGDDVGWGHRVGLYSALIVLMPLFGLLEAVAVMYGIARPERGFTVITKSNIERSPAHGSGVGAHLVEQAVAAHRGSQGALDPLQV